MGSPANRQGNCILVHQSMHPASRFNDEIPLVEGQLIEFLALGL
jgi:hypothetical protein